MMFKTFKPPQEKNTSQAPWSFLGQCTWMIRPFLPGDTMLSGQINSRPHTSPWAPKRKKRFGREMGTHRLFQWNLGCCNNLGRYFCFESFVGDMFLVVYPVIYRVSSWYKISSINSIFKKSDGNPALKLGNIDEIPKLSKEGAIQGATWRIMPWLV